MAGDPTAGSAISTNDERGEDGVAEGVHLGLDTGGTFTDAVLYREATGVVAKAKALTTRPDLETGIAAAADAVIAEAAVDPGAIDLVCLSTTLATNALVEGQAGRVALVMIGFTETELQRDGLGEALGDSPAIFLPGGHDVHGRETPLDLGALQERLGTLAQDVEAVAVAGYFAVRNPAHEEAARDLIREATGLPVTCSHELSSRLGGPRRALTTLLNARLIGLIDRLLGASENFLKARGIKAPLMIVRGDGALIAAAQARLKPIETILSGPAASLVGARHLTGLDQAIVSDIGGTTTDVALIRDGLPRLDMAGAVVGGYRTMVEAVAMRTSGLGGDSEVAVVTDALKAELAIGPRRVMPLSLAAATHGRAVTDALQRQFRQGLPGRLDGRFALRTVAADAPRIAALPAKERQLFGRLTATPQPLDTLLSAPAERATLERLVKRGYAIIAGFTPSDAMHVLGRQKHWDAEAARLGADLMARRRDAAGKPFAESGRQFSEMTAARLTLLSARVVLESALAEDELANSEAGLDRPAIDPARSEAVARALSRRPGIVRFSLGLDRPLVALGASAHVHYPAVAEMLGAEPAIPEHADVANAIGAVVGQVRIRAEVFVTAPSEDRFAVTGLGPAQIFANEEQALAAARALAREEALKRASEAGAGEPAVSMSEIVTAPEADGRRQFVEAVVTATAIGRPAHAR